MTVAEPEWDDHDRATMMALALIEADECPGCHGSLRETTDVANDGNYDPAAIRCHRCSSIATFQNKGDFAEPRTALLWTAALRDKHP